jgi:hypothetical protein
MRCLSLILKRARGQPQDLGDVNFSVLNVPYRCLSRRERHPTLTEAHENHLGNHHQRLNSCSDQMPEPRSWMIFNRNKPWVTLNGKEP